MGSWSVYCGVSQIAITEGQQCVLLPIKKNNSEYGYTPYIPATLPIFGRYNDYGEIGGIEETASTKLIEEHFGINIQEFCDLLSDGIPLDRSEAKEVLDKMKHANEFKNWKFMWIDRKVWDFMSTNLGSDAKGHLDFGNEGILKLLGFKYNGENAKNKTFDPKRFNKEWEIQGKKFYSDGTWLEDANGKAAYYYKCGYNDENSLTSMIDVPEDLKWIGDKSMCQMWKYVNKGKAKEMLGWIIGKRSYDGDFEQGFLERIADKLGDKFKEERPEDYELLMKFKSAPAKSIAEAYMNNLPTFGDGLAELVTVRHNLNPMSGTFTPYILYLTPQCGEYSEHQKILNKFAEINKARGLELGYDGEEIIETPLT